MDAGMFHPHGWCFQWEPPLIGLHVGSDAITALAYFSLPLGMGHLLLRRRDLPFKLLFALSGAFIVLCGLTHLASIVVIWQPVYWTEGVIKAATALVSIATAIVAVRALPQMLRLPNPLVDPLTDVASRAALFEMADKVVASGRPSVVLYVDLDGFKVVNDRYGHGCGDAVLREAARRVRAAVRPRDVVGRLGGDEFAAVLPNADEAGGERVAEAIRAALREPISVHDITVNVGASVGLAPLGSDFEASLRLADRAMYAAKSVARGR
jgi:diguanylate cyclase (GGDEF)-like protein